MNTVKKGNKFEEDSYILIKNAIENDVFGIKPEFSKVYLKKGYYSELRKKEIIFDLSIEIWPPKAERFSNLYLIECKSYTNKKVPVDDLEEFLFKVNQIANQGHFIKAVFISDNSFQDGTYEIAKNARVMLLEVNEENELLVKLHKEQRNNYFLKEEASKEDKEIETFLFGVFNLSKVEGLKKYSRKNIENIAINLLNEIDIDALKEAKSITIEKIIEFFDSKHNLKFLFDEQLSYDNENTLGYFDSQNKIIKVDKNILNTNRFAFVLAHELGHFLLHRDLKIYQQLYNKFQDSEYSFSSNRYLLNNYKNWIEWQANEFAASFLIPTISLYSRLIFIQKSFGISKSGHIYLDEQPVNKRDFGQVTNYLADFFNTTPTSIIYRLENLDLISYNTNSRR